LFAVFFIYYGRYNLTVNNGVAHSNIWALDLAAW